MDERAKERAYANREKLNHTRIGYIQSREEELYDEAISSEEQFDAASTQRYTTTQQKMNQYLTPTYSSRNAKKSSEVYGYSNYKRGDSPMQTSLRYPNSNIGAESARKPLTK